MSRIVARGITRRYGATCALDAVDFTAHAGAVNVLIGENGAGKSTLMRIIAGVETADEGELLLDGRPVRFRSIREAAAHGIGIVHQELSLCSNLTVAENIFMERGSRGRALLDHATERMRTAELLARLGATFAPETRVANLSVGEQQVVEIARALSREASVLILDEPTSALSAAETERLFAVIAELRAAGVAIIYISHRMQEIERIGDHVTVLRNGRRVAAAPRGTFSIPWIVRHMLDDAAPARTRTPAAAGPEVLEIDGVSVTRSNGSLAVANASFAVRSREMTGIYGLLGAGRTELFEAICGARDCTGAIRLAGEDLVPLRLDERLRRGVQLVPEDRKADGLFHNLPVLRNLSLSILGRLARAGVLRERTERAVASPKLGELGVKTPSADAPIGALSGGNQQKVLIGRSLLAGPRVLLLDEPGRGVDVGARAEIFETMRQLAGEGVAIVFSTSDLHELLGAADRILVMAEGRITADLALADADEEAIVRAANPAALTPHEAEAA